MKPKITIHEWVKQFQAIGLDEAAMQNGYRMFEKENAEGHQNFLEWLGLPTEKIREIRQMYD